MSYYVYKDKLVAVEQILSEQSSVLLSYETYHFSQIPDISRELFMMI